MNKTWKTVGTVILTVYLTLVTVGCVIFGYLYFAGKSAQGLSFADAKALVNEVCVDFGLMDSADTNSNSVKSLSMDEENYADSTIDLNKTQAVVEFSQILLLAKFGFDDPSFKQNVNYRIGDKAKGENPSVLVCTIKGNTLSFQFYPIENLQSPNENDIQTAIFSITKTTNGYECQYQHLYSTAYSNSVQIHDTIVKVENRKPFELKQDHLVLSGTQLVENQLQDAERISQVERFRFNTKTQKMLVCSTSQSVPDFPNAQTLTDAESKTVANEILSAVKGMKLKTTKELKTLTLTETDWYEKLVEYFEQHLM